MHFDVAHFTAGAHVPEEEEVSLLRRRDRQLGAHAVGAEDVDVPDAHRVQLVERVAVEVARRHVRVDDRAAGRIDQQLHGAVVLEHLPVAALALAQRVFLALLLDGGAATCCATKTSTSLSRSLSRCDSS